MRPSAASLIVQYVLAFALALGTWWLIATFGPGLHGAAHATGHRFAHPGFLYALLLIPLLVVVRAHTLSDLPAGQQFLSLLLRAGVVVAIALALMGPETTHQDPVTTETIYVVDVSDSIPDAALDAARARVGQTYRRRGRNTVRLVLFAARAHEVPLGVDPEDPVPPLPRFDGDGGRATDAEGALRLAYSLLSDEVLRRVVLVTDGLETRGNLLTQTETARRFGIRVHHLDFTHVPRPGELMVTGIEVPDDIRARVPFEVRAAIRTTAAMEARCELLVDGVVTEQVREQLEPGETTIRLRTRLAAGGERALAVQCNAIDEGQDRFHTNNRFATRIVVPEKPKVLYLEGERRYGRNLITALAEDFDVELRGPEGMPQTRRDADRFDLIFVSDVPRIGAMGAENVTLGQMRVLEGYVRAGGGLVMAGGENAFGPGGYGDTHLERKVLPVTLDVEKKQDIPSLALMLVIDRSGSMSGPKIVLAKEAARATLDVLQPSDKLGIIAFDAAPKPIVRLQRAANRLRITDALSRLSPGGGTNIFPALDQAYQVLSGAEARVKHIILLTDGQSNRSGILDLVAQSYQDKITISTVAVGMGADQGLLMQVAEEGGGRYYFTDRPDNIPKLFLKEASEVSRRALIEDRFRPRVTRRYRSAQVFKGIPMERAPSLLGYVATRPKKRAEVLMVSHHGEPILARWRLGLGQVWVWTSDVKNKWAHYWLRWSGYAKFWRQLIRDAQRVEKSDPAFHVVTDVAEGLLRVGIDAIDDQDRFLDGLEGKLTVRDPAGREAEVRLEQVAPGRYEGFHRLGSYGPYTVVGTHHPTGAPEALHRSHATVSWPYPTEHLAGEARLDAVRALSVATGGGVDPSDSRLFDTEGRTRTRHVPQWPLPIYIALALLFGDVLLRRLRLYGRTVLSWSDVSG